MSVRPASPETDFPGITAVVNAFESESITVEIVQNWFTQTAPGRIEHRRVAVNAQDQVVGYSVSVHETWSPLGQFYVWVGVLPAWRRQGHGTALYADILSFLQTQGATDLTSEVLDSVPADIAFAQARGFVTDRHMFESTLDLAGFDSVPYRSVIPDLEAVGFRFFSLADCPNTAEYRRQAYAVNRATAEDIPGWEGSAPSFEDFEKWVYGAEWYRPDGQILVAEGENWVGISAVRLHQQTKAAYNVHTGVLRPYRGRRLGLALKLATIQYARAQCARYMRTNNDSLNAPILALNNRLGYRPEPGRYTLRKRLA